MNPTLLGFIRKELFQTLRDRRMRMVLFVAPVIQLTLFGVALSNEVKNVRLSAQYQPGDILTRDIYQHAIASKWFVPADVRSQDPYEEIRTNEADAVIVAPPHGLLADVGRGDGAKLQLLVNASNVIRAQAIEVYIQSIAQQVLALDQHSAVPETPIRISVRILYNPMLDTSIFMVPGVMCLLLCIVTLILTTMSISKEKEMGTFEMLISAPITSAEIILGKTLPYVVLGMVDFPLILGAAVLLFGVPVHGSILLLTISAFFFICSSVAIGMLISTLARTQQQATLGSFLFLFPAILLSGLIFPLENMPTSLRFLATINPLAHFVGLLRNIMLKGGDATYIYDHIFMLILLAAVTTYASFKRFRTTLQ